MKRPATDWEKILAKHTSDNIQKALKTQHKKPNTPSGKQTKDQDTHLTAEDTLVANKPRTGTARGVPPGKRRLKPREAATYPWERPESRHCPHQTKRVDRHRFSNSICSLRASVTFW